jgi:LacI family transcriptional regulator
MAAKELRYRSNRLSHGILRGKSGLVGVIIPLNSDTHFSRLLSGIAEASASSGLHPLLSHAGDSFTSVAESVHYLMEYRVDAIVCVADNWGSPIREGWLEEILVKRIPLVIVDDRSHTDVADCIVSDDVTGAETAVQHLLLGGHRRIAHLSGGSRLSTSVDRRTGYLGALGRAGVGTADALIVGEAYDSLAAREAAKVILDHPRPPTAVFAANDRLALEFMREMRQRGLECPRDIAVVGYADTDIADALDLTSVSQDSYSIGQEAIQLLEQRMRLEDAPPRLVVRPTQLVVRNSSLSPQAS